LVSFEKVKKSNVREVENPVNPDTEINELKENIIGM
jgi:hypothetical protein